MESPASVVLSRPPRGPLCPLSRVSVLSARHTALATAKTHSLTFEVALVKLPPH